MWGRVMEGKTSPGSRGLTKVDELPDSGRCFDPIGPYRPRAARGSKSTARNVATTFQIAATVGLEPPAARAEVYARAARAWDADRQLDSRFRGNDELVRWRVGQP